MIARLKFEDLLGKEFNIVGGATVTLNELPETQPDWIPDDWPEDLAIKTQVSEDQPFRFIVAWKQVGELCKMLSKDLFWQVEILLEQMGEKEFELPKNLRIKEVDYVPVDGHPYAFALEIPRRSVPAGVYRPVVMVNLRMKGLGDTWMPVAGFAEFPPIQFYED
jgi:hypothetical protein